MELQPYMLPHQAILTILDNFLAADLCHIALCNRSWREAANQNALWRPLCRDRGWEHYGTTCDLLKESPFVPASSTEQQGAEANPPIAFPTEAVVASSDWPNLGDTCKWKEIYMKARHLKKNWKSDRYHISVFDCSDLFDDYDVLNFRNYPLIDVEKDLVVGGCSYGDLGVWDLASGNRRHVLKTCVDDDNSLNGRDDGILKVRNGTIAVGCMNKIYTYSAETGEQLQVMSGADESISRLFFDDDTIVSIGSDIRVWRAADGSCLFVLEHPFDYTDMLTHYRNKILAAHYWSNSITYLWDVAKGTCLQKIETEGSSSCCLGDGFVILTSEDGINMWSLTGELLRTIDVPDYYYLEASLSNDTIIVQCYKRSPVNIMAFTLDGDYIDGIQGNYTNYDELDTETLSLLCLHNNRFVTYESPKYEVCLWGIHREKGFKRIKVLQCYGYPHDISDMNIKVCMNDTKMAFFTHNNNEPQYPRIVVHHYW